MLLLFDSPLTLPVSSFFPPNRFPPPISWKYLLLLSAAFSRSGHSNLAGFEAAVKQCLVSCYSVIDCCCSEYKPQLVMVVCVVSYRANGDLYGRDFYCFQCLLLKLKTSEYLKGLCLSVAWQRVKGLQEWKSERLR